MDLLWYARYKRGGGGQNLIEWEFSSGLESWEEAPAPALMGKRIAEGFLQRELPASRARLVNNVMHWAYGLSWGALYGLVAGSVRPARVTFGPVFGAVVWGSSYVVLPLADLYKPIWKYDWKTLAKDLSAHLIYGATTAATFQLLAAKRWGPRGPTRRRQRCSRTEGQPSA
jgi:hypothetical protein